MIDKLENDIAAYMTISALDTNVKGIILNSVRIGQFSHAYSNTKQYFDVVSVMSDDKKYNELKSHAGESLAISNESGKIEYSITDKLPELTELKPPTPKIPILDEETKLLDFSELTRKNSGEKAYRLGVMQKLIKEGYLQDIEVPPGFVIPLGYINKIYEYINEPEDELERKRRILNHPLNAELANACRSHGVEDYYNILRSAFNAEDLPDYPTAGIYHSYLGAYYRNIMIAIDEIVTSKDERAAINSRKRYGLEDAVIQPTIIVEQRIKPDYKFTLYTDSCDGKLKIETYSCREESSNFPAVISYDKESEELKIEDLPYAWGNYVVKDTGEVVEQHLEQHQTEKDWESLIEPFKIAVKNALKLEQYFGRPQDIEGGIKDGKVYFWQTRDIVKKAVKR
jgi:phosphoenolpyruvate synthase/pyruvate phosphate dikinase